MAQFCLGAFYFAGVPKDAVQASNWFRKAAEQGVAIAQAALGSMYKNGDGVPKDAAQAVTWNRKAAEQGYAAAQSSLGFMYLQGTGVRKNAAEAAAWIRKAADQGDADAQHNLGLMYQKGEGVPRDAVQALYWYRKAAEQGDANAQAMVRAMEAKGEGAPKSGAVAQQPPAAPPRQDDPIQRSEQDKQLSLFAKAGDGAALKELKTRGEQGDGSAQILLYSMYSLGEGVPRDPSQAEVWWNAFQRSAGKQNSLESASASSKPVQKASAPVQQIVGEPQQSAADLQTAAASGDKPALERLRIYAEQGNAEAQTDLAFMYAAGQGVPKDTVQAAAWYRKAADQGNAQAQSSLGYMYS